MPTGVQITWNHDQVIALVKQHGFNEACERIAYHMLDKEYVRQCVDQICLAYEYDYAN